MLNNLCINSLFSFLDDHSLYRANQVCQNWHTLTDQFWKSRCLSCLDEAPYEGSWKKRFKIIRNWKEGRYKDCPTFHTTKEFLHINHDFIIDNHQPIEVYPLSKQSYPIIYTVKSKTALNIHLKDFNITSIVGSDLQGHTWFVLTSLGEIVCFDIRTGQCLKRMEPEEKVYISSIYSKIKVINQEVVTYYDDHQFKIWDIGTGGLKQTIRISEFVKDLLDGICTLDATSNFIVYIPDKSRTPLALQKKDPTIKPLMDSTFRADFHCMVHSGPYLAILSQTGQICIFKDTEKDLSLTHCLTAFDPPLRGDEPIGALYAHQNWLFANKNGELKILDIKTGNQLCIIQHALPPITNYDTKFEFCTNGIKLFARIILGDPILYQKYKQPFTYKYITWNFDNRQSQKKQPRAPVL